jgi:hypothetical protein
MNLFFLQTFILNYFFIVIPSDQILVLCFIKTQPFVKRKPVKTEKNTGTIAFRFRQVLLYYKCIPLGVNVFFQIGVTLPDRSDLSPAATTPRRPQPCTMLGNRNKLFSYY